MKNDKKNVYWLKSKMFLTDLITAILSFSAFFVDEMASLLNDNFDFLKDRVGEKYIYLFIFVVCIFNTFYKMRYNQPKVVMRKRSLKND